MVEARLIVKDEDALSALLSAASLSHLSIDTLAQDAIDDRPALLSRLKADGVEKLADRQKLANALSKAARARGLEPRPKPPKAVVLPTDPVLLPAGRKGLTIHGKTDGFGAQLQAQISGIAYCQRPSSGRIYVHSRMGPRMDNELHNCEVDAAALDLFGGMAVGSPRIEDVVSEAGHSGDTIVEDRYGNKTMANGRVEVHDYIKDVHNAPTSKDVGEYYTDAVLELLRAKYHSTPKPQLPSACYGAVDVSDHGSANALPPAYAAIHIRRGDVTEDAHPRRFTPNDSYLPLLRSLVARHPDLPIIIFSQGRPDDFEELIHALKSSTVALCLDEDVRSSFHALVCAKVLVVARSSFSYCAGLLTRGTVYCDVIENWWHQPHPSWMRVQS